MAALILLCRLKEAYPNVRGSSGHRLFLAALMLADKFLNDESYENEDWVPAARGYYALWEIHQMEREMCRFLTWDLRVDGVMLQAFENSLRAGFSEDRAHYSPIPYTMVCNRSRLAPEPTEPLTVFSRGAVASRRGSEPKSSRRSRRAKHTPSVVGGVLARPQTRAQSKAKASRGETASAITSQSASAASTSTTSRAYAEVTSAAY
ncbi:hypothetical protein D9611_006988 [Ephemerocybe angulata]|uniref:Cyclin N-terminal domain-containing protein n=1 Tax=Ephemerocybe angulata TaxID=980116 RepID=A0A8H5B1W2_9AGAR|nr:hypothetical protein D9611_006988 [Tulosesus angulatus]